MDSIRISSQRIVYAVAAFVLVAATVMPAVVSAAQVTKRSVALSSSSKAAKNVNYKVTFTPAETGAGAFLIDFCGNTPLIGQTCGAPGGFSAVNAATSTADFTVHSKTATRVIVSGTLTQGVETTVDISGIDNPTLAGPLYARIVTYDTAANAALSTPTNLTVNAIDQGGVAMSITDTIGVTGVVLETLTFCVSKIAIEDNCQTVTAPSVQLGENNGGVIALTPNALSEDSIYTQISTNASGGAIVRLKSNAAQCGGLLRAGAAAGVCDINPALNGILDPAVFPENPPNDGIFGVKTNAATPTTGLTTASGSLVPYTGSFYNNTTYSMNYDENEDTGVTSTFGDPFLQTDGEPVNGQNMKIDFGATVGNNTPAGAYSADMSLIAVGKF